MGQRATNTMTDDEVFEECAGYCRPPLTDSQLRNVRHDELERGKLEGETGRVARIFARAAKEEMLRRGMDVR